jgi:hypothetical protein
MTIAKIYNVVPKTVRRESKIVFRVNTFRVPAGQDKFVSGVFFRMFDETTIVDPYKFRFYHLVTFDRNFGVIVQFFSPIFLKKPPLE